MTNGQDQEVQAALAASAVPAPTVGATPTRPIRSRKSTSKRTGTPNGNGTASATPDQTVSLSLPADVHAYFAAEAEKDERTLAQFLRRTLREVWRSQTMGVAQQAATGTNINQANQSFPEIRPFDYPQA